MEDAIQPTTVANDKNLVDFTKYRDFCLLLNSHQALVGLQWAGVEGQLALCKLVFLRHLVLCSALHLSRPRLSSGGPVTRPLWG